MLKDLSTAQAADILVQLAPLVGNITQDEDLVKKIGVAVKTEGMTKVGVAMAGLNRLFTSLPVLLGAHRDDIFGIIAVIKGKTVEEVANQSIMTTKEDLEEILSDEDFISFFGSFGRPGKSE